MSTAVSSDGTAIGFERSGDGPPVILVGGAFFDRSQLAPLAALLASDFTILNYDRRGRGKSGDTPPYALEREIDDLDALIDAAGGAAFLFGGSSGAALALEAAAAGLTIEKMVLCEAPYLVDDTRPAVPADIAKQLTELLSAGRRGDAVALFMTAGAMIPPEVITEMLKAPGWAATEEMAVTLPYDAAVMGIGNLLRPERLASITAPTLVIDGGASPPWIRNAAQAVADALPNAARSTLPGQHHDVDQDVLAPVVADFLARPMTGRDVVA